MKKESESRVLCQSVGFVKYILLDTLMCSFNVMSVGLMSQVIINIIVLVSCLTRQIVTVIAIIPIHSGTRINAAYFHTTHKQTILCYVLKL